MSEHNFAELYEKYDSVVDQMPALFTSHQFILQLAQQHQALYIDALYSYRDSPAPFKVVHGILAKHLTAVPGLEHLPDVMSTDIFGGSNTSAQWRKL